MGGNQGRTSETLPTLQIAAVLGDSNAESMAWSRAIGSLSRRVEEFAAGIATPIRVNVIYHVDGRIAPNEFDGVRTGRFDQAKSLLVVQAAVPARMPDQPERLLLTLLAAAIEAAEVFAKKQQLAENLSDLRGVVGRVDVEVNAA